MATSSSPTRGLFIGGDDPGNVTVNTVDSITMASTGDAIDFGDLENPNKDSDGTSNGHGGL